MKMYECEFTGETGRKLVNRHHLRPRPYRGKNDDRQTVYIDRQFHSWLHSNFTNSELARSYSTLEELKGLFEIYKEL